MTFLFDLDDTLENTSQVVFQSMQEWCAQHGLDVEVAIETGRGRPTVETVALLAPKLDAKQEAKWVEEREIQLVDNAKPIDGAVEFVSDLAPLNWAVVTSSSRALAFKKLAACDFPVPDVLVSADDILRGKPDPEPFITAASKLSVAPSDCIAFEDSESGVISALEAGCRVVAVGDYSGKYSADIYGRIHSFRQLRLSENGEINIEVGNS